MTGIKHRGADRKVYPTAATAVPCKRQKRTAGAVHSRKGRRKPFTGKKLKK